MWAKRAGTAEREVAYFDKLLLEFCSNSPQKFSAEDILMWINHRKNKK